jgi:hypothetical protein
MPIEVSQQLDFSQDPFSINQVSKSIRDLFDSNFLLGGLTITEGIKWPSEVYSIS